ncbi:MAG: peptidase T [Ignavibacteriae bacterium]|nr:MAG: peptidase T [Ignavibacteriota bacterium]
MSNLNINHTVTDRFLRYVKIDTQSDPDSNTQPSTEKQLDLMQILVDELHQMGIDDAELDEFGYVYATVPATSDKENVPVLCFCSHVDTSPDVTGKNVNPIIHKNYDCKDIILPGDTSQIIRFEDHPALKIQSGNDIITTDGKTLLGADDKAGVAEIMDAVNYLVSHPEIKHGKIRILFTPDEEIGRGVNKVNMKKLGAQIGYTMDGSDLGSIENETFCADGVNIIIHGVNFHPGWAKGKMQNAIKIACDIIEALPKDTLSPETTEDREGFIHPIKITGGNETAEIKFIIRDFTVEGLNEKEDYLQALCQKVMKNYNKSSFKFEVQEQYRNFKFILDKNPAIIDNAIEAVNRTGVVPELGSIRGGTDGSRLSYIGLPCPNIFTGGHAYHSKLEWVSVQDMQKAVETIVHLCMIWEEKSN